MAQDSITANLPSRDFSKTYAFYAKLGFEELYRDPVWMIMARGDLVLEFFSYVEVDPYSSSFSACVRVADVDALHAAWCVAKLNNVDIPRLSALSDAPWGMRTFHVVDLDGSLLRVMEPIN